MKFNYSEDKKKYMQVLDTCIEHYKLETSRYIQSQIATGAALLAFLALFTGVLLGNIGTIGSLEELSTKSLKIIIVLILTLILLLPNLRFFNNKKYHNDISKLDELLVAKIVPEEMDLEVEMEESKRIKNVRIFKLDEEKIQEKEDISFKSQIGYTILIGVGFAALGLLGGYSSNFLWWLSTEFVPTRFKIPFVLFSGGIVLFCFLFLIKFIYDVSKKLVPLNLQKELEKKT